jgi:hypothetical protein
LKRLAEAVEASVPKNQVERFAAVAQMELRAPLLDEACLLQTRQHTHLREDALIVGQERFAHMEPGKLFLFQDEHLSTGAGKIGCRGAATRSSTNHNGIVDLHDASFSSSLPTLPGSAQVRNG